MYSSPDNRNMPTGLSPCSAFRMILISASVLRVIAPAFSVGLSSPQTSRTSEISDNPCLSVDLYQHNAPDAMMESTYPPTLTRRALRVVSSNWKDLLLRPKTNTRNCIALTLTRFSTLNTQHSYQTPQSPKRQSRLTRPPTRTSRPTCATQALLDQDSNFGPEVGVFNERVLLCC